MPTRPRVLERGADVLELEAGGVGGDYRGGLGDRLELGEQAALRIQVLEDRLDDDVGCLRALPKTSGLRRSIASRIRRGSRSRRLTDRPSA